jgi:hypothetical protein
LVTGRIDKALYFDGVNNYVSVPHDASLNPTSNSLSLSFFFKPGENWPAGTLQRLLYKRTGNYGYLLQGGSGGPLRMYIGDGTVLSNVPTTKVSWSKDITYHALFSWNGTTAKWFIDGQLDYSGNFVHTFAGATVPLLFGLQSTYKYKGFLDHIILYNRALTQIDAARHAVRRYPEV